jgi:hypothetical protein
MNTWRYYDYIRQHPGLSGHEAEGEAITWGYFGMLFFGCIFFLVCGCLAIAYRAETKFYLWLGMIAIIQPIVFLQISDIHSI